MSLAKGRKLLLSSVCKPFGVAHGDGFGAGYHGAHQVMWAQGIFQTRGTSTQWGIEYIAANLKVPTTTLHYPTMEQFIAELDEGYDYVGIAFVAATLHKMQAMVGAIREHAPKTKIILGGYGAALGEEILGPYADHICQGEGVAFMRRLLGERPDAPIQQPEIVQVESLFSMPIIGPTGYVFAGLGCPNGCDFCATSHFFKRQHIKLLPDGRAILTAIQQLREYHPRLQSFYVSDEDFLLNRARGAQMLGAIRKSRLPPLSLSIFSSVKALSQYSVSELVEMGIDFVWVGFEGKRAGYSKMQGRAYKDLFRDLHQHGISVLASMIIGFDYQTPAVIEEEYEELVSLRPSLSQFLIYGPAYGTPLFTRLQQQGRLREECMQDPRSLDGFTLVFDHPHIGPEQMSAIQRRLYQKEFARLGPSVFRVVEDWITGHVNLRDHGAPRVRDKAQKLGRDAHRALTLIPASKRYVNADTASWLDGLQERIVAATGQMSSAESLASRLLVPTMMRHTDRQLRAGREPQPQFTRRSYRQQTRQAMWREQLAKWARQLRRGQALQPLTVTTG